MTRKSNRNTKRKSGNRTGVRRSSNSYDLNRASQSDDSLDQQLGNDDANQMAVADAEPEYEIDAICANECVGSEGDFDDGKDIGDENSESGAMAKGSDDDGIGHAATSESAVSLKDQNRISKVLDVNTDVMTQMIVEFNALKSAIQEQLEYTASDHKASDSVGQAAYSGDSADGREDAFASRADAETIDVLRGELSALTERLEESESERHDLINRAARLSEQLSESEVMIERLQVDNAAIDEAERTIEQLRSENDKLQEANQSLVDQSSDLASQVAGTAARKVVPGIEQGESLSWEERKELIYAQMADDSFDAGSFVESLNETQKPAAADDGPDAADESGFGSCCSILPSPASFADPVDYVNELHDEIRRRDEEIRELRILLDEQSTQRGDGVAVGAAAIAGMVDADELVTEERERLKQLQAEWEEKFREGEIAASLERAKLSRERRELAKKQEELAEQIEHARRASQVSKETGGDTTSRRWLAKLGLDEKTE